MIRWKVRIQRCPWVGAACGNSIIDAAIAGVVNWRLGVMVPRRITIGRCVWHTRIRDRGWPPPGRQAVRMKGWLVALHIQHIRGRSVMSTYYMRKHTIAFVDCSVGLGMLRVEGRRDESEVTDAELLLCIVAFSGLLSSVRGEVSSKASSWDRSRYYSHVAHCRKTHLYCQNSSNTWNISLRTLYMVILRVPATIIQETELGCRARLMNNTIQVFPLRTVVSVIRS